MNFDIVIRGGSVIDGTGHPRIQTDIGIVGDRIAAIGMLDGADAAQLIDATGKVVAPGFIDVHVHSELALLGGTERYAPLKMGVTTQLSAPDGFAWAPLGGDRLAEMKSLLHVFYDQTVLKGCSELSVESYLRLFHGNLPSNVALQAPHGSIRAAVCGWDARPATDDEITRMARLVTEWMEAGAVALCTGLEYEPMRSADLRELVSLSMEAGRYEGVYVAHQRGYAARIGVGCAETFAIGQAAGVPVHISHLAVDDEAAAELERGRGSGLDVTFDMYPYPAGCTHLLYGLPEHIQAGPPERTLRLLSDPAVRAEIKPQVEAAFNPDLVVLAAFGHEMPTGWEGKTLREISAIMGLALADTIYELLLMSRLQCLMVYHWTPERYELLKRTFQHPLHMVGTDGVYIGRKPHPRGYGTFPKVLGEYVRENDWLGLEQAVYKMTGFPARTFHLSRRGVLQEGFFADIVVFDPDLVAGPASFEQPKLAPVGIDYVLVNGKAAVDNARVTEGLYGKVLTR